MRKHVSEEVNYAIDDLVEEICLKADEVRIRDDIADDDDVFCLMDALKMYWKYIEKAQNCRSVNSVKKLRERMDFVLA